MATLTKTQIQDYVRNGGEKCPYCGGIIEGIHAPNVDAGSASQEVACIDCGKDWIDVYQLVSLHETS